MPLTLTAIDAGDIIPVLSIDTGVVVMEMSPMVVNNNILRRAFDDGFDVTPMKLQRLIYLVASEYAKETGTQLLAEDFQAWKYGAVVRSLFDKMDCLGGQPVTGYLKDAKGGAYLINENSDTALKIAIDRVWRMGRHMSPVELSRLVQRPDSAWHAAWLRGGAGEAILNAEMACDTTYRDRMGIELQAA